MEKQGCRGVPTPCSVTPYSVTLPKPQTPGPRSWTCRLPVTCNTVFARSIQLDPISHRVYNAPPCSPQARLISGQITVGVSSFREIRVMGERNHTTTAGSKSGTKKTWTLVITGTAVLLLAAGVMLQVTRPPSAFP